MAQRAEERIAELTALAQELSARDLADATAAAAAAHAAAQGGGEPWAMGSGAAAGGGGGAEEDDGDTGAGGSGGGSGGGEDDEAKEAVRELGEFRPARGSTTERGAGGRGSIASLGQLNLLNGTQESILAVPQQQSANDITMTSNANLQSWYVQM